MGYCVRTHKRISGPNLDDHDQHPIQRVFLLAALECDSFLQNLVSYPSPGHMQIEEPVGRDGSRVEQRMLDSLPSARFRKYARHRTPRYPESSQPPDFTIQFNL